MILYRNKKQTLVVVADPDGHYRSYYFNTTDAQQARLLVREYGHQPDSVTTTLVVETEQKSLIDDLTVLHWVEHYAGNALLTYKMLLDIVRKHDNSVSRIIGGATFLRKYRTLIEKNINLFIEPTPKQEDTWKTTK